MNIDTTNSKKEFCKNVLFIENITDEGANKLMPLLKDLSDREERIIRMRYGLDDNRQRSLEEVARDFGITREMIRQIESKAIKKLRHPTRLKELQ